MRQGFTGGAAKFGDGVDVATIKRVMQVVGNLGPLLRISGTSPGKAISTESPATLKILQGLSRQK